MPCISVGGLMILTQCDAPASVPSFVVNEKALLLTSDLAFGFLLNSTGASNPWPPTGVLPMARR
jgi:hypothetical protein